jgi:DNA-binding transcriptional LysR family regulator
MNLLRSMRVFVQVADEGSFAAAARALELAPAIVTRAVAELEQDLGARLLHRTTRRLALTEIGAAYLERARQILADIDEASAMASARTHELRGTVRLLAPPAVAVHQIAKHLPRLHQRHPELSLQVDALAPVEAASEAFDLSIVWAIEPLQGEYVARRLARTETVLCATPDYLDRRGRPSHPVELERHDTLTPPINELQHGFEFLRRGVPGGAPPAHFVFRPQRTPLATAHVDTNYAAALAGLGVAALPSFVVADALAEHALEWVLPDWQLFGSTLWATMPTRKHVPARTRAVLDFLLEVFGGQDEDPWLTTAGCATPPPA